MGIMARNAGQASVWLAPAFAVFKAVRRKAGVQYAKSYGWACDNIFPGTVARAAEVDGFNRIKTARIHDCLRTLLRLPRFHGGDMSGAWSVTGFAGDAKHRAVRIKLILGYGSSGVAAKTSAALCSLHGTSSGVFQARRRGMRWPRSDLQIFRRSKIT